jgi:hypothetical protein
LCLVVVVVVVVVGGNLFAVQLNNNNNKYPLSARGLFPWDIGPVKHHAMICG